MAERGIIGRNLQSGGGLEEINSLGFIDGSTEYDVKVKRQNDMHEISCHFSAARTTTNSRCIRRFDGGKRLAKRAPQRRTTAGDLTIRTRSQGELQVFTQPHGSVTRRVSTSTQSLNLCRLRKEVDSIAEFILDTCSCRSIHHAFTWLQFHEEL